MESSSGGGQGGGAGSSEGHEDDSGGGAGGGGGGAGKRSSTVQPAPRNTNVEWQTEMERGYESLVNAIGPFISDHPKVQLSELRLPPRR